VVPQAWPALTIFPSLLGVFVALAVGLFCVWAGERLEAVPRRLIAVVGKPLRLFGAAILLLISIEVFVLLVSLNGGYDPDCPPQAQRYC
jgi:hypothetical protein